MNKKDEIKWLEAYAKKMGYKINYAETEKMKSLRSDDKINLRLPKQLKSSIQEIAKEKNIPYQRYIKEILIDAIAKEKAKL
jgi:predicted DNA binding CopG/RHH family protein